MSKTWVARCCDEWLKNKNVNNGDLGGITPLMQLAVPKEYTFTYETFKNQYPWGYENEWTHFFAGKQEECIRYLVKHKSARINQGDKKGRTVLWYAIDSGQIHLIPVLVECGVSLCKDGSGISYYPIVQACKLIIDRYAHFSENEQIEHERKKMRDAYLAGIKQLIQCGCDPNGAWEKRPLDLAMCERQSDMVALLIELGAEITASELLYYRDTLQTIYDRISEYPTHKDTKCSKAFREAIIARDELIETMRSDQNSYFSKLPRDLTRIIRLLYLGKTNYENARKEMAVYKVNSI